MCAVELLSREVRKSLLRRWHLGNYVKEVGACGKSVLGRRRVQHFAAVIEEWEGGPHGMK